MGSMGGLRIHVAFGVGLLLSVPVGTLRAQAPRATVAGTATDESGAVVPGVKITVVNSSTGIESRTATNEAGAYYIPFLPPGQYRIVAEQKGFERVEVPNAELVVNETTTVNLVMKLGRMEQKVMVRAEAPILQTDRATLGHLIDHQRVENLPLLGRNPYSLVALIPGARPSAGLNQLPVDQITTANASINGSRGNQNEYLLDGAPNSAPAQNQPVVYPSADAVEEFKVDTNNYSAEFGRAAGGVFNVVTKSGGSQLHGNFYDFLRNDKFDATNFFVNRANTKKPSFRWNQFGATVGGPLVIPKLYDGRKRTFFFADYEGARVRQGITYVGTVPTALQRQGDFSQTFNSQGQQIRIFDPVTTLTTRSPFSGNKIQPDRIDPVARNMLQLVPAPNTPGDPVTGVNNYISTASQRINKDTFSGRVDQNFSERQRLFGRFTFDSTPIERPDVYGNVASPSFGPQTFNRRNLVLDDVLTLNPTLIANGRYSISRLSNFRTPRSFGFDITQLGFPQGLGAQIGLPSLFGIMVNGMAGSFSDSNQGTASLLGGNDFIRFGMDSHAWQGSLTKVLTRHTLKIGGEFRLIRFNTIQHGDNANVFNFGAAFTQGPDPNRSSNTAGFGFASFLLGTGSGTVQIVPALALQQTYTGLFFQDDFRVTPKLTLNLGVRYDYEAPRTDRFNQLTNFDFSATPPLQAPGLNLRGGLTFVGVGGHSRQQWEPQRKNFAPRLGFAYQFAARTVLRGGFGIFFAPTTGVGGDPGAFGTTGFLADTTFIGSLNGVTPFHFLKDPYPEGINQPTGSSLGLATQLGQTVQFVDRNVVTPYAEQWNLDLQRELPGGIQFEVGYAGSRGLKLQAGRVLNQLPDSVLALGTALQQLDPNPFFGQIQTGALSANMVSHAQLLRPYPQFTGVTAVNSTWGASTYHALLAKLDKRFAHGVNFIASYSFSKLIDNVPAGLNGESLSNPGIQDNNNLRAERAVSTLDIPQRLVLSYIWQLPFGPGRRFLANSRSGKLVGGWQIGGISTFQSGVPLGVVCGTNVMFPGVGGCRPNMLRNPRIPGFQRSVDRWIDTTAFAAPAAFTFGNAPRTIPGLRGDQTKNLDFSVSKRTPLTERFTLEFRAEFFNLLNRPQFAPPNLSQGNATSFGTINSQANTPRLVQFALKLSY